MNHGFNTFEYINVEVFNDAYKHELVKARERPTLSLGQEGETNAGGSSTHEAAVSNIAPLERPVSNPVAVDSSWDNKIKYLLASAVWFC